MDKQIVEIKEKIAQAEVVLVGLGLDFEKDITKPSDFIYAPVYAMGIKSFEDLIDRVKEQETARWIENVLFAFYKRRKVEQRYEQLAELLKGKNYFVVSLNTSELIFQSGLEKERIVMPCGNEGYFQCKEGCCNEIIENHEYVDEFINNISEIIKEIENGQSIEKYLPKGTQCGHTFTFNVRDNVKTYVEEGYLPQWKEYMTWLSKTLNKNLVMLELDVNFVLPGIIRWAFEKNAFLNNKAVLVRVNKGLPQRSEEIKDKGFSVQMSGKEFLQVVNK